MMGIAASKARIFTDLDPITPSYIMQLHKILLSHTPLPYGGKFKSN